MSQEHISDGKARCIWYNSEPFTGRQQSFLAEGLSLSDTEGIAPSSSDESHQNPHTHSNALLLCSTYSIYEDDQISLNKAESINDRLSKCSRFDHWALRRAIDRKHGRALPGTCCRGIWSLCWDWVLICPTSHPTAEDCEASKNMIMSPLYHRSYVLRCVFLKHI